jgi:hypothetical protein
MKVPSKFQVFSPIKVDLTAADAERLTPHIAGWRTLNESLLLGISEEDLRRLVVIELLTKQRRLIIDRLMMRLGRAQRERTFGRIDQCMSGK